jgi:WD40 repeat protein
MSDTRNQVRLRPVIRVFVSSTFSDMKHERNALQADVFPKLEQLCLQNGFQFQAIDMRWGVSTEAGLDHRTMRICSDELRRAQEISHRPNFLILLGNRYGWRPLPEEIPVDEFQALECAAAQVPATAKKQASTILREWYREDKNAIPKVYLLQSRRQHLPDHKDYTQDALWNPIQAVLWEIVNLAMPPELMQRRFEVVPKDSQPAIVRYQASATEQEIWRGAFQVPDANEHVLAFFREIQNHDDFRDQMLAKDFVDVALQTEQERLKKALTDRLSVANILRTKTPVRLISACDSQNRPTIDVTQDHLVQLCTSVVSRLSEIIQGQIEEYWRNTAQASMDRAARELEIEQSEYERFAQERGGEESFVGRQVEFEAIIDYLGSDSRWPFVIHGTSGCGKTALLARASQEVAKTRKRIERFIGVTPRSSDLRSLLSSLCQELRQRNPRADKLPTDINELRDEFSHHLQAATLEQPLILFLDALDQLADADNGRLLNWLPSGSFPAHVKLVVSCTSDRATGDPSCQPFAELKLRQIPAENFINLNVLSEAEACLLLFNRWLSKAGRKVSDDQRVRIEQCLKSPACRQPIFLKLLFEEVKLWHSYDPASVPSGSVSALLSQLIDRLSLETNHGQLLVNRVLGYLAASRHGLAENEILEILFADPEYRAKLNEATEHFQHMLPPNAKRIPISLWSRLRFDLAHYLTELAAPGTNVLTFYHRQMAEFVRGHLLDAPLKRQQLHERLAGYFSREYYFLESQEEQQARAKRLPPTPRPANMRKVDELPYQQIETAKLSGEWEALEELLTNLLFLEAKTEAGAVFALAADFKQTLTTLPAERAQHPVLCMLEEALLRDTLFLSRHPTALFQCLWNTCWWYKDASHRNESFERIKAMLISWRRQRHRHRLGNIWIRSLRPPPVPLHSGLLAVFRGHENRVLDAQFSPKGIIVASSSADCTVRLWDHMTGRELLSFERHSAPVHLLAFNEEGETLASASIDGNLWVWSTLDATPTRCIQFRTIVNEFGIKAEPKAFFSIQFAEIDLDHKKESPEPIMRSLRPESPLALSFLPQNRLFVCVSNSVFVIDLATHKVLYDIPLGSADVDAAACDVNGTQFACAFSDGTIRLIDLETQQSRWTMQYPGHRIWRLVFMASRPILVLALDDHSIRLLSTDMPREIAMMHAHLDDSTLRVFDQKGNPVGMLGMQTPLAEPSRGAIALGIARYGEAIAFGGADGVVQVWWPSSKQMTAHVRGHDQTVSSLNFSACGQFVVSASIDGTARVWQLSELRSTESTQEHTGIIGAIQFCAGGRRVVSADLDGAVHFYNSRTGRLIAQHQYQQPVRALIVSSDSHLVASAGDDGRINLWEGKGGTLQSHCQAHADSIHALAFSTDGLLLASAGTDRVVNVWRTKDLSRLARLTLTDQTDCSWCLKFSCDGSFLSAGTMLGLVNTWHCSDWHVVSTYGQAKMFVTAVDLSPDVSRLAIGTMDGSIHIWDTGDGSHRTTLRSHAHIVTSILFSSDSKRLLTESMDNTIREWDAATGLCLRIVNGGRFIEGFSVQDLSPWGARVAEAHETLFECLPACHVAGAFPFMLAKATTAQAGRIWAGVGERNIYLVRIETETSDWLKPPAKSSTAAPSVLLSVHRGGSACDRLASQAQLFEANGELLKGREALEEQEILLRSLSNWVELQKCLGHQAQIRSQQGDLEGALNVLQQQEVVCSSHKLKNELLECLNCQLSLIREIKQLKREESHHE